MKLNKILKLIDSNIAECTKYQWDSFGPSNIIDFNDKYDNPLGSLVVNKGGSICSLTIEKTNQKLTTIYNYVNPKLLEGYKEEYKKRGLVYGHDSVDMEDTKYIKVDSEKEILKLLAKNYKSNKNKKENILVNLSDETFNFVATQAHIKDITFNQMVAIILKETIDNISLEESLGKINKGKMNKGKMNKEKTVEPIKNIKSSQRRKIK